VLFVKHGLRTQAGGDWKETSVTNHSTRAGLRVGFNARHLADPEVRGLTRYTVCLLRAMSEIADLELVLFSMNPPCPEHMTGIRAEVVTFGASREVWWNYRALPRMIANKGISVFHAPADRGVPLIKSCPLVVTVHDSYERTLWPELFPQLKNKLWYWTHELANRRADAVLTVSDTTRKKLVDLSIAPEAKIHRIYLAHASEFQPNPVSSDQMVLRQYGISSPYVLYVGGYDRRKNVQALVSAFDCANLPKHELVVVAKKQSDYQVLFQGWKLLSCFPRLRLIETRTEHIPALYRHADFFVNPSIWESFSFQLVEAMACGTPILASNRTAIPEICGGAALLFDPEDIPALSGLMKQVAGDPGLKQELRGRGFQRVQVFSWRNTAEETVKIYRSLLRSEQSGA
jgi:glycosyltransferase involved in cell wall biosynthesis